MRGFFMRIEDYETNQELRRGKLHEADAAAWNSKLSADASLAREVALDAAIDRGLDRILELEPQSDSLNRVMEGAGLAPVLSLEESARQVTRRVWWQRHWAIEAGLVAAALVVVAVLFVLPTGDGNPPVPEAKLVDVSDWVVEPYEVDATVWMDLEDLGDDDSAQPAAGMSTDSMLMASLLSLEMARSRMSWEVPGAGDATGIADQEDWLDLIEGLDY
jgi:hypothetical protein